MLYGVEQAKNFLIYCAQSIEDCREKLTEIDSQIGDGDLGSSMQKGMEAVRFTASAYQGDNLSNLLMRVGIALNGAAPSTMGTLLSSALMALGKKWSGKKEVTEKDLVALPRFFAETISKKGNAQRGDKTILDALFPYAEAFEKSFSVNEDLADSAQKAVSAAWAGMEETKQMQAHVGRARWLGERSRNNPDGGAALCAYLAEAISSYATKTCSQNIQENTQTDERSFTSTSA